ncbi:MAG: hypothetical protein V4586_16265 [Pseudomonadota bacterium]
MMKSIAIVALLVLASTPVLAEKIISVKIEAILGTEATIKGVPCSIVINGVESKITTPATFDIPVDRKGMVRPDKISCRYKNITRSIGNVELNAFRRMQMNFEDPTNMQILFY